MPDFYFFTTYEADTTRPHFFFNSPAYIDLYKSDNTFSFFLQNEHTKENLAVIHFELKDQIASSPGKAPFGFLETAILNTQVLQGFWKNIESILKEAGAKRIELRSWADCYFPEHTVPLSRFFHDQGFAILYSDYNFHRVISSDNFLDIAHSSEKRRFQKCIKAGFSFEQWPLTNAAEAYDLLADFRQSQDIPLNISKEALLESCQLFPDNYSIFIVRDGNKTIGISVCVQVSPAILYNFCPSTDPVYNVFSPSVTLYEGIYQYCQQKGYQTFDFGTASIYGEKQEGLCEFKQHLGGIVSYKPTFGKGL